MNSLGSIYVGVVQVFVFFQYNFSFFNWKLINSDLRATVWRPLKLDVTTSCHSHVMPNRVDRQSKYCFFIKLLESL